MCVGYEFLLLPNKMPTKTSNREMSVVSCFLCFSWNFDTAYTKSTKSDLTENSMTLYSFIKYSQMLLLWEKTHDISP